MIIDTKVLSRSVVKEEVEYTLKVSQQEAEELEKAVSLINSYKVLFVPPTSLLSDWHNIEFRVDTEKCLVYALVSQGMTG